MWNIYISILYGLRLENLFFLMSEYFNIVLISEI